MSRYNEVDQWVFPEPPYVVYTYKMVDGKLECHAYGSANNAAPAGVQFTQAEAEAFVKAAGFDSSTTVMVLPLESGTEPGV